MTGARLCTCSLSLKGARYKNSYLNRDEISDLKNSTSVRQEDKIPPLYAINILFSKLSTPVAS